MARTRCCRFPGFEFGQPGFKLSQQSLQSWSTIRVFHGITGLISKVLPVLDLGLVKRWQWLQYSLRFLQHRNCFSCKWPDPFSGEEVKRQEPISISEVVVDVFREQAPDLLAQGTHPLPVFLTGEVVKMRL